MSELTIAQTQKVIGWSYPTALEFAKANGRMGKDGRWLIPYSAVSYEVERRVADIRKMEERLLTVADNGR